MFPIGVTANLCGSRFVNLSFGAEHNRFSALNHHCTRTNGPYNGTDCGKTSNLSNYLVYIPNENNSYKDIVSKMHD